MWQLQQHFRCFSSRSLYKTHVHTAAACGTYGGLGIVLLVCRAAGYGWVWLGWVGVGLLGPSVYSCSCTWVGRRWAAAGGSCCLGGGWLFVVVDGGGIGSVAAGAAVSQAAPASKAAQKAAAFLPP